MSMKEFRDKGFLQEINRQFLHPLGLAMAISIYDDGNVKFHGIQDYRDDPEGVLFDPKIIDKNKIKHVKNLRDSKKETRLKLVGSVVQKPFKKGGK